MNKYFLSLLASLFLLMNCKKAVTKEPQKPSISQKVAEENEPSNPKIYVDTLQFVSYNDDGDYWLLYAKKGEKDFTFINTKNDDRSLLRGDVCEINWKNDTIYNAGDNETPEIAKWIIKIKKIKDGNVSKLRKEYGKPLKYHYSNENHSQDYLDKLYLLTEFYIANTSNPLIKSALKNKDQLEYSIEERTENNRNYEMIGIGYTIEHRFTVMQWIYVDREDRKLFEYDLANEKLTPFD